MSKKLCRYLNKRMEVMAPVFHLRTKNITDKQIHQLRLEIKKLKAMFAIIQQLTTKKQAKSLEAPYAEVFDQAGKVREAQLMQKMISSESESKLTDQYMDELKANETKEKNKLQSMLDSAHWKELVKTADKVKDVLQGIPTKKAVDCVLSYERQVLKEFKKTKLSPDNTHDVRSHIKELGYQQSMLDLKPKRPFPDKFQELIGHWHDGVVLLTAFKDYTRQLTMKPTQKQIAKLIGNQIACRIARAFDSILYSQMRMARKM